MVARQINGLVMQRQLKKVIILFININSYVDLQRILFSPQQKLTSPVSNWANLLAIDTFFEYNLLWIARMIEHTRLIFPLSL